MIKQNAKNNSNSNTFKVINGYTILEELGKGSYGTVYKVQKDQQIKALKMIHYELIKRENLIECVESEIAVMKILNSIHCLKLYEVFEFQKWKCLVIEYCNEGTLLQYITKVKPDEEQCMRIFIQILNGFKEIHEKKYLHRDLKPENIFIHNGVFKIADFGLAKAQSIGQTQCGSSYYMSPEILQKDQHDHKTDLWSLGVILYFMMFRDFPFKNKSNRLTEIKKACAPEFNLSKHLGQKLFSFNFSQDFENLFKMIFVYNPKERNSFSYIYQNSKIIQKYLNEKEGNLYSQVYKNIELDKRPSKDLNIIHKSNSSTKSMKMSIKDQNKFGLTNFIMEEEEQPSKQDVIQNQNSEENVNDNLNEGTISKLNSFNIHQQSDDSTLNSIGPKFNTNEVIDDFKIMTNCRNDINRMGDILNNNNIKNQHKEYKSSFQAVYQTYIFNIQKYNFIGDTINLISNLELPKNTDSVIHYILCKLLVFFALQLKNSLEKGENIFQLQHFNEFLKQKRLKKKLQQKIDADILRWNSRFVMFYYSIDINSMIKNEELKKIITMEVTEKDYNTQLKQPSRLVLDSIFKISYTQGMQEYQKLCQNDLKAKYQQINNVNNKNEKTGNILKVQNTNQQQQQTKSDNNLQIQQSNEEIIKSNISNFTANIDINNDNEQNQEDDDYIDDFDNLDNSKQTPTLKISFCILLCMVINSIFSFQSTKQTFPAFYNYLNKKNPNQQKKGFDFWKFYMWIQKASGEQIIESIHIVIKLAYGNQKLKSIQNMVESNEIQKNFDNM